MQSYFDTVTNQGGAPISGASVFVYDSLGALATLFSDNGVTPQSNPIVTGADGKFIFFAANGIYSAVITAPSYNSVTIAGIALNDPAPVPTFTGTGAYVLQTSPTLITPNLGTPSAATLISATGLPISTGVSGLGTNVATALAVNVGSAGALVVNGGALGTPSGGVLTNATGLPLTTGVTGTLPVANGGTGISSFGAGVATFLGTPSSANLAAAVTDETGTGALVFATSPTLVTPALGTPSSGTLTSCTGLPIDAGTTGTLAVNRGGTGITAFGTGVATALGVNTGTAGAFVVNGGALGTPSSGTLTSCTGLPIDGGTTGTLPAGRGGTGLTALGTGVATFLGTPSSANLAAAVTGETGTGALVFATSPTLVTPTIGVATATSINSLVLNRGTGTGNAESVAVGGTALDSATNGEKNTAVGYAAGTQVTSGKESIFIGWTAGKDYTTGEKSIYIGPNSQASSGSVTKEIVIGAELTGKGGDTFYVGGANGAYNEDNNASWLTTSDQRIKKNIVDSSDGLAKIQAVRVRNFEYRAPNEITDLPQSEAIKKLGVQIGVIAQEMLPECVRERSNGVLSVDTDRLVWYLINAVKQLAARIEELEK